MGKNKLARWNEFGSFANVIQPEIGEVTAKDHPVKGKWGAQIFKNNNPLILELGCGKGEYTVGLGKMFPKNNYTGVDIKGARMWRGAKTSNELKMNNVAFLRTRIEFISSFFSQNEVDEIWITFPDPHPGPKNSGKRLTSPPFLKRYTAFLKNNAIIHLKTDNTELHKYTLGVIEKYKFELLLSTDNLYEEYASMSNRISMLELSHNNSGENIDFYGDILSIKTHYEKQFLGKGMKITYLAFRLNREKLAEYGKETAERRE